MKKAGFLIGLCCLISVHMSFFPRIAGAAFPEKEITIINMAEPGMTTDTLVRALIIGASKYLGKNIVVDYKPGSGGMLAATVVSAARPDGYTLFSGGGSAIVEAPLMQKAPFKPLKSFTPIVTFATTEHTATLVAADAPWKTFKEFVDYAKKNPGKLKLGISQGSSMHIAMEYVRHQEGSDWTNVPFSSGGPARTAVMGHHIDAATSGTDWPPFVEAGQLRALVTHGRTRAPWAKNVPTLVELGYNFASYVPQCILGPAGIPQDVLAQLETAFAKGMETPEFKTACQKVFVAPTYLNSKDMGKDIRDRWAQWEKLFKQFGFIKEAATQPE